MNQDEGRFPVLNIGAYADEKASGAVRVIRINGVPTLARKAFDPISGKPIGTSVALPVEQLERQLEEIRRAAANLEQLIADAAAAEEVAG